MAFERSAVIKDVWSRKVPFFLACPKLAITAGSGRGGRRKSALPNHIDICKYQFGWRWKWRFVSGDDRPAAAGRQDVIRHVMSSVPGFVVVQPVGGVLGLAPADALCGIITKNIVIVA